MVASGASLGKGGDKCPGSPSLRKDIDEFSREVASGYMASPRNHHSRPDDADACRGGDQLLYKLEPLARNRNDAVANWIAENGEHDRDRIVRQFERARLALLVARITSGSSFTSSAAYLCTFAHYSCFLCATVKAKAERACAMFKRGSAKHNGAVPTVLVRGGDARNRTWTFEEARDGANRQREKIRQIGEVLRKTGFVTVAEQSTAVGLSRSTTWKILQGGHKTSGLHAGLVGRMLSHKELPHAIRNVLREYVIEKARGQYGHSFRSSRCFAAYFWDMPELADFLKK